MSQAPETPSKAPTFNARDAEFMYRVVQNMKNKPEIDWDAVAQQLSLKNGNVASVRFGQIKKKFQAGGDTPTPTKDDTVSPGSGTNLTPTKVRKPRAKKPAGEKKVVARGRKKAAPKTDESQPEEAQTLHSDVDAMDSSYDLSALTQTEDSYVEEEEEMVV